MSPSSTCIEPSLSLSASRILLHIFQFDARRLFHSLRKHNTSPILTNVKLISHNNLVYTTEKPLIRPGSTLHAFTLFSDGSVRPVSGFIWRLACCKDNVPLSNDIWGDHGMLHISQWLCLAVGNPLPLLLPLERIAVLQAPGQAEHAILCDSSSGPLIPRKAHLPRTSARFPLRRRDSGDFLSYIFASDLVFFWCR